MLFKCEIHKLGMEFEPFRAIFLQKKNSTPEPWQTFGVSAVQCYIMVIVCPGAVCTYQLGDAEASQLACRILEPGPNIERKGTSARQVQVACRRYGWVARIMVQCNVVHTTWAKF